ncbi:PEP-CTERM sorting domain-containing protein [Rubritalea sp.]|uniref:PEP-CTERM sorting domain-containing protein n=1 Tax=Rubritalea sp. TaxID=2109375 RepID=UPI003EFAEBDA
MKTTKKVATLAATLITIGSLVGGANAAMTMTINEVGNDLVFSYSGTLDSWTSDSPSSGTFVQSTPSNFYSLTGDHDDYITSGIVLDSGNWTSTSLSGGVKSGDNFGFDGSYWYASGPLYTAGTQITGSATYTNTSYATAGFTIGDSGSFSGGGNTVSFQVAAVPEPSSALLVGLGALSFVVRRRRTN